MSTYKKRPNFPETEEGIAIRERLIEMAADAGYNTMSSYSANGELYPDNVIPFVEKHMSYLCAHPTTNPQHYLSNLRLMTRKK